MCVMRPTSEFYPRQYIPQVNFNSLATLSQDELAKIKRCGTVLIKDVVDDAQALQWKDDLKKFVKVNDERGLEIEGIHNLKRSKNLF